MSKILVDELIDTPLVQPFMVEHTLKIASIRPVLYVHNVPAGDFSIGLYHNDVNIKSYEFTSASAKAAINTTDNYFWLYLALPGDCNLTAGTYEFRLEAEGYTYAAKDYSEYPYAFRIVEYVDKELV
jgi:hypothetical protein